MIDLNLNNNRTHRNNNRIATKLRSEFYLIYKLTSVHENSRSGIDIEEWKLWLIAPPKYNGRERYGLS
jgi:hypothetical protein